ncbi:glycosyltransferase family 2 protein [Egicoccus halophilus]|uniref:Succinoglycan biosynthesis protein exoa n=1 Tax=Egicoccus halophilus TaxID=1670830 RepID=A0A8J3A7Y9_9ACTN|nr:glycosyltransferase family 2 protein [Egicoccus halophilus]GGI05993.1 succinoglycan biosynthesis protein exoa [Egicoccus halophilus]
MSASDGVLDPLPAGAGVSVVVPALHAQAAVGRAVRSALAQDLVDEVVVAAGDPDTARAVTVAADGDPRVRVVDNPSGRTPDALNAAIDASNGEVVVRLDAHAVLPPGYVARAVETLRRTGAANVGGKQVPVAERGFARAVAVAMASPAGAGGATYRVGGAEGPVDTVYLGVFRRSALTAVGGYDPRFTRNQDAELNVRLAAAGYTVWFDPRLAVDYTPRDSVRGLAAQYLQYGRWRRLTARTHRNSLGPRQLAAPLLVVGLGTAFVLSALSAFWPLFGLAVATYVAALVVAAAPAVPALRLLPEVVVALGTMHVSWGIGFLLGPPRMSHVDR